MKLQPIEQPRNIKLKMAYWMTRRQTGKVMTPLKVIYARKPALLPFIQQLFKVDEKRLKIPDQLRELLRNYIAHYIGCRFCEDIGRMRALKLGFNEPKLKELMEFAESRRFSGEEKAALHYVDELLKEEKVSDPTFQLLKGYFSEEEIVEITWVYATERYLNIMNKAFDIGKDGFCEMPSIK